MSGPALLAQTPAGNGSSNGSGNGTATVAVEGEYEAIRQKKIATAVRITEKMSIDGKLEERVWDLAIPATDFLQWEPKPGALSSERTEARFLYDNDNLYVGIMCWDSDPSRMIVNELKEDFASNESDGISLTLDTLHDRRSAFGFGTNPAGARRDYQIMNDGAQYNMDWDGVWDVKVSKNDQGWIAEFVIPFKTLRFSNNPTQVWGLQMLRRIRRTNEDAYWAPIPRRFRGLKISLAGTLIGLEGISQGRNFKVKPYATAGVTQLRQEEKLVRTFERDGGLDAKYGLSPELTLDMTYRTDFSQVEVDQQQVNLTRFNLFFPEKRDFFLENAGTFSFGAMMGPGMGGRGGGAGGGGGGSGGGAGGGGGGGANLIPFFSRRIGLDSSTGKPIPIIGGTRLSGKVGNYDVGFLAMKTDRTRTSTGDLATPSNNYIVARAKRNLLKNSWLGTLVTHRDSTVAGDFNRVYGADARFQFWDKLDLDAYVLKSKTPRKIGKDKAGQVAAGWRENDYSISFDYQTIQTNFNPEVGFVRRKDISQYSSDLAWRPRPKGSKLVRNFNFSTNLDYFQHPGGKVETRTQSFNSGVFFQNSATLNVNVLNTFDRLDEAYEIRPGNKIPVGDYGYRGYSVNFNTDRSRAIAGSGNINAGDFWNGRRKSFGGGLDLKPNYHLNIDLSFNRNQVRLPTGSFTASLFSTRVLYSFTSRSFLNAFVQYNADTHQVTSNIRFNITHRPLSDLYLVYNDRRDTITGQLLERAFIVKLTNLFTF